MSTLNGHREVIVVGGGQAGLAIGYLLTQQGRHFTILEATDTPAAAWRARWDSLRLFTPVRYDSLPGRAFPGHPDTYPGRDDVVAYLTDYARDFELPVELNSRVRTVRRDDDHYLVELDERTYHADQVVIATGPFQTPFVPPQADRLDPSIVQFHSTEYRNPDAIPDGPCSSSAGATPASRSPRSSRAPSGARAGRARGTTRGAARARVRPARADVHLSVGARQTPLPQRNSRP